MSNKSSGTAFEKELAKILFDNGFWVLNIPNTFNGQCADIIAVNKKTTVLIDAKECKGDRFVLSRIEDNQLSASELWKQTTDKDYYLAIKLHDNIYFLTMTAIHMFSHKKSLNEDDLKEYGFKLRGWLLLNA